MIYELHTSTGQKIKIDDEDLNKISENADAFMVIVKQGVVRPPFISIIVPTKESDTERTPITEIDEDTRMARVVGFKERNKVEDLMGNMAKKFTQLPQGNTLPKQL